MSITATQSSMQRNAVAKLMDLCVKENFIYVKKISLIACTIIFSGFAYGVLYGASPYVTVPGLLIYGALSCYQIKHVRAESLDIQQWKPICEDILGAKYVRAFQKLSKIEKNKNSLAFTSMTGKKIELNKEVLGIQLYVLAQVFPQVFSKEKKSESLEPEDKKSESFETIKERVNDQLSKNDKIPHNMLDVVKSMKDFPKHLMVVKSKIHFVLTTVLEVISQDHTELNKKQSQNLFSSIRHSCKTARRYFHEDLSPVDARLLNSIENCSTIAAMQIVLNDEKQVTPNVVVVIKRKAYDFPLS